jgi:hypothetical protein
MTDPYSDPLARDLAALAPKPTAVTSAAVLYAAGQQAAELKANRWRMVSCGLVVLFVGSWIGMSLQPEQPTRTSSIPEVVYHEPKQKVETPIAPEPPAASTKPIPQLLILSQPDEETLEDRIKGIRLKRDILAGGLGLIPEAPKGERPRVPGVSSMEMNPTVLGGHYSPKRND